MRLRDEVPAEATGHPWVSVWAGRLRFGVGGGPFGDWSALCDFVQMVEDLGFDSYWLPDHPLLTPDCWTTLAAVAVSTKRVRIGSMVTCAYYRNPVMLARVVADVDRLSRGRVVLGLGAGDMQFEFEAMGLGWPAVRERRAALVEVIQVVQRLLRGELVTYDGTTCLTESALLPLPPLQHPHVPLLIAGGGEQSTLRLVAQYADASNLVAAEWGGGAATAADVRRKYRVLEEHCVAVGRAYTSVLRTYNFMPTVLADSPEVLATRRDRVPPRILAFAGAAALLGTPEEAVQRLRQLVDAGCQYFNFGVMEVDTLRLLADRVVPALATLMPDAIP
jgi:alkanesulfonate monooxygenase SsuD/methylene tetrahydromethanopterin reductase-like flavin-dependent oxidoreductase (luciferase family)